jgi:hypothetical protein
VLDDDVPLPIVVAALVVIVDNDVALTVKGRVVLLLDV